MERCSQFALKNVLIIRLQTLNQVQRKLLTFTEFTPYIGQKLYIVALLRKMSTSNYTKILEYSVVYVPFSLLRPFLTKSFSSARTN